jgi:hypothetical protein
VNKDVGLFLASKRQFRITEMSISFHIGTNDGLFEDVSYGSVATADYSLREGETGDISCMLLPQSQALSHPRTEE